MTLPPIQHQGSCYLGQLGQPAQACVLHGFIQVGHLQVAGGYGVVPGMIGEVALYVALLTRVDADKVEVCAMEPSILVRRAGNGLRGSNVPVRGEGPGMIAAVHTTARAKCTPSPTQVNVSEEDAIVGVLVCVQVHTQASAITEDCTNCVPIHTEAVVVDVLDVHPLSKCLRRPCLVGRKVACVVAPGRARPDHNILGCVEDGGTEVYCCISIDELTAPDPGVHGVADGQPVVALLLLMPRVARPQHLKRDVLNTKLPPLTRVLHGVDLRQVQQACIVGQRPLQDQGVITKHCGNASWKRVHTPSIGTVHAGAVEVVNSILHVDRQAAWVVWVGAQHQSHPLPLHKVSGAGHLQSDIAPPCTPGQVGHEGEAAPQGRSSEREEVRRIGE
mmetsp:Transcript_37653/g.83838  ORF Transcript_37653/g.83838 Transcript_37653/m.83838 type:complete len:389 (+) Transcript_37653:1047-2213(+)